MSQPLPPTSVSELYALYQAHPLVSIDSRQLPPQCLFFALRGERFDGNAYAAAALAGGAAYAIVDDAAVAAALGPQRCRYVKNSQEALQALANHHRQQLRLPVLAITGSNGKTTTKELIASVMAQHYRVHYTPGNYNNHLGVPLTLLQIGADIEMAIIEMGANHQREIAALCRIAEPTHGLITNIGEAHLEGFGGLEGVKIGKGELYDYLAANGGVAFVNLDAEYLPTMAERVPRRINYLASAAPNKAIPAMETQLLALVPNVKVGLYEAETLITAQTQLPGHHNFENIKAAVAVGKYFKVPAASIVAGLEAYQPQNNRSERQEYRGVAFFLDAYNANPSSTEAALRAFAALGEPPRAVVLGEMLELGTAGPAAHHRIAALARGLGFEQLLLVGAAYAPAAEALSCPYFVDVVALRTWFWAQDWQGYTIMVKGSRGVKLEQLLQV
ncbi:MAG: UDP-N-acetylmuramoyl-tripeptide--D-alanyl-D-alanine ligase [Lewinella sp.]|nr:UDP-N-acetylmuramoyl-tripeptide--D-alanyl-D-alanine ligase [Lewinella sp.]